MAAALMGALGVALAAASAHAGGREIGRVAAEFGILHGVAALSASGLARNASPKRAKRVLTSGFALLLGTALFSGDLAKLALLGSRLFPFAAPSGGLLMIFAWVAMAWSFALPNE